MKIAMVAPEVFPVPPVRGGAVETTIEELSGQLQGHDVHIFCISDPSLPLFEKKGHQIYHRYQRGLLDRMLLCSWRLPFKQSNSRFYQWPYVRWIAGRLKKLQPDVVQVHSRIQFIPWIRKAAPNAKIILTLHNLSNLEGDCVWNKAAIESCDVVAGVSRLMIQEAVKRRLSCQGKTAVLYNGVNLTSFQPIWALQERRGSLRREKGFDRSIVILFVGRLVEVKGAHVLVEAFKRVAAQVPDATLVIVGSHTFSDETATPYIRKLQEDASGLDGRIRFAGYVSREHIQDYFLMSDIVAFPSLWNEPFGAVVVEAMASGLPVVAFDEGGHTEILRRDETGILVPKGEGAEGLAKVLIALAGNAAQRAKIGCSARQFIEQTMSWRTIAQTFLSLCNHYTT